MGKSFEVHEAHVPYVLQVFIDHNLYGMNYIHLSRVSFRAPVPTYVCGAATSPSVSAGSQYVCTRVHTAHTIGAALICNLPRTTSCDLECDAVVDGKS